MAKHHVTATVNGDPVEMLCETEDTLLDARRNNYLASVVRARESSSDAAGRFALAWIDISTGEFGVAERDRNGLAAELARLSPGEIIISENTLSKVQAHVEAVALPPVELKGKEGKLRIFNVVGLKGDEWIADHTNV